MKRIGICLLAACMLLGCAACGTLGKPGDPKSPSGPESAAASSQPADDGLDLDDFTVVAFDKDGPGDHGCRYEMTGQEQAGFLALLQPQHWIEATELPEIGVSGLTVLDKTGERGLVVGRYQEQALILTGDKAYFAPLAVYEAACAFEKPFLQRKQEEKTQQASGASPEKEAEGAESRPEGSAPSSSPEQPPVPEAASFCMIETTGSDLLSFYPLSDSEQRTFQQLLRVEEWKDPTGLVSTGGMGSPCIIVGQKDGDATLYLSPGFTRRDGTSPGQFPPDLEVKNTLILIKYGEGQKYHAAYFAPVEVLAEADAFRLRCRTLQIDARWEELQPQELPWYDAAAQTVYAQEQADLEPFLYFQAMVRDGQVSTLRLFDQPNDHREERFPIGQENILRLLDSLRQIEAGFTEKPTGNPSLGGGCDLLVGFADGTEAYLFLRSGEDRFSFATSDGGYYSYGCANQELLQEISAVSYIVSYCGGIDPGAENIGIR